jgi:hypothetical protein
MSPGATRRDRIGDLLITKEYSIAPTAPFNPYGSGARSKIVSLGKSAQGFQRPARHKIKNDEES